eukprot:6459223-Amphidinium_carterae.1
MVARRTLLRLAGQLAWVGSIIPRARPFVAQLWAGIADATDGGHSTRRRPATLIFVRRVLHATKKLETLIGQTRLQRRFSCHSRALHQAFRLRTDASPWGFGGVLMSQTRVLAWWADP